MDRIAIFDTSVVTENMGDYIVMDYCNRILEDIFYDDFLVRIPTHERISQVTYRYVNNSKYSIVCGTNLLTGKMRRYNQWKLLFSDTRYIQNVCLMGVGWRKYGEEFDIYSRKLWNKVLSHSLIHSVRDSYTESQLKKAGFTNVLNTSCPTMWGLNKELCASIPQKKANKVVMTTTRYNQNREYDEIMLQILLRQYNEIYFWVQSLEDYQYVLSLTNGDKLKIIPPKIAALDRVLSDGDVDYCGTRLHAGIRALNHRRRTIIIATDNRAIEIARDTMLPICKRENVARGLESMIAGEWKTTITLPWDNINKWISQFK